MAVLESTEPLRLKIATAELREAWLEIRNSRSEKVVTVIELLSHSNKASGSDGREKYLAKQEEILGSDASLVEIDLLRSGAWTVAIPEEVARGSRRFHG